ncbi:MAG: sigma-70 family RNA polymerase sigma factor [Lachnospiraceae bacterium]|nr:sigma-70 family RNA polymerase sigma factor [Lachnospiraceae bacterium]
MNAKEYLSQAKYLDAQINSHLRELDYWRDLAGRVSGSNFEAHYNPNRPTEAPFVHALEMIDGTQNEIDRKLQCLVTLKAEISAAIDKLENQEEKLVLRYRYLDECTWEEIGRMLHMSERSVYRLHGMALKNFTVPE